MELKSAHILAHSKCLGIRIASALVELFSHEISLSPYQSTCFNRIDLPLYSTRKELEERLRQAITLSAVGFDME